MKLKENFVTQEIDGEQVMVSTGDSFSGMVRSNKTAAFIVDCLKTDTTQDAILDAMCGKYDAPREVMADGIKKVLDNLRRIGALDE
ncbi:MAG: PqqD family protein [Acutalibacteraceae bacterium]